METKKRKAGSNKGRRKQREYKGHVRAQILAGWVNSPDGAWVRSWPSLTHKSHTMAMSGCAGHLVES